jgi:hypothetical protein
MNTLWIKLRADPALSWHIVREQGWTLCGREGDCPCPTSDSEPMGEKTCETCLRIWKRNQEGA